MANTNDANDPFQTAFDTSMKEFRAKLKNADLYREILQTKKIEDIYDVTDKLQEEQSRTGRLRHLSKIEPFLEGLKGYASVIEVFMQAKPDVLALLWGPIKLILQWADVLKQSMDAIIDTIAEIGNLIPEFRMSSKLFGEKTAIREILLLFFKDILDFYVIALNFFSLPRLKLVFESLWPRQRDKIKVVVTHLQRHTHLLRNEVRWEHIQAEYDFRQNALERFEKAEDSHRRQEYQSLRTSIAIRTYEEKLQYLDDRACQEAGIWLMKHNEFRSWMESLPGSNPVLWLQGIPGSGKTHLARTVVHEARKRGHSLFAFLSYNHSANASALSILHSLVFQLSADDSTLQSVVCQSSGEGFRHSIEAAKSVFRTVSLSAGIIYMTIDGLDEIESAPRCQILSILLQLSSDIDGLRLLVSCRAEADITSLLKGKCSSIRINELNTRGIQAFITQRTSKWYEERDFFPEARKEIENRLTPLANKSKGMFLYVKIVLDTIEFLEPDEILEDLKILPDTMDDAYGRILERINKQPPTMREKARTIIGWIGVSPSPFTIHELEQALIVQSQGIDGTAIVKSKFPIDRVCGPIIEVINEYVQFVHFTVQQYFLSSLISTAIDPKEARLGLAVCCLTYLCQRHHDRNIEPATRSDLILIGAYRLNDFAVLYWLKMVEEVFATSADNTLPIKLTNLLETLRTKRGTTSDNEPEDAHVIGYILQLKKRQPALATMLCNSISFRATCDKSSFKTMGNIGWAGLEPLDISLTTCHVHMQMKNLLTSPQLHQRTMQETMVRHYGERLFKCQYIYCSFQRHGFVSKASCSSHEKGHEKPWNCYIKGCEFEEGGFLSRKMRDEHLKWFHNHSDILPNERFEEFDEVDFKNVCLDLIKADDVSKIGELAEANMFSAKSCLHDLITCAAQYASPDMMKILLNQGALHNIWTLYLFESSFSKLLLPETLAGNNSKMLEYLLHTNSKDWDVDYAPRVRLARERGLADVLAGANDEMLDIFCTWVGQDLLRKKTTSYLVSSSMIAATSGDVYREQILLGLWKKVPRFWWAKTSWKNAILNVASTTCSVELAKFLIDQGVPVNWRIHEAAPTSLVHAARKTNSEAAELVRLLLFSGADTVVKIAKRGYSSKSLFGNDEDWVKSQFYISEENGARQISKWLGVTFEELVAQAKKTREELENPHT